MSFFDWIASIRKKPLETRRRIASLISVWAMGILTAVWFIFFFSTLPSKIEELKGTQNASPQAARPLFSDLELPPFPELPAVPAPQGGPEPETPTASTSPQGAASSSKAVPARGF